MSEEIKNTEQNEWELGIDPTSRVDTAPLADAVHNIKQEISKVIVGQNQAIDLMIAAVLTGGHVLLEGLPGIAKTLTAKLLAQTIAADFSRIQFTPDLMPTDVTGTSIFNLKDSSFYFRKGPIFSNIVLIDEINRSPAKTQAALMEVMEERQITYDGQTYQFEYPFIVVATQNPIEQEGTYSLPEAQLDRFVFRIKLGYPSLEEELEILTRFESDFDTRSANAVQKIIDKNTIQDFKSRIEKIYIRPELLRYIASVIDNTRNNGDLYMGASPRASLAMVRTSKAIAAMNGRDFVTPDDIRFVAVPVLNHRLIISHEREMEGVTLEEIIQSIIKTVEVPR